MNAIERYLDFAFGDGSWWRWALLVQAPFVLVCSLVVGATIWWYGGDPELIFLGLILGVVLARR